MPDPHHWTPDLLEQLVETVPRMVKGKGALLDLFKGAGVPDLILGPHRDLLARSKDDFKKFVVARTVLTAINDMGDAGLGPRRQILYRVTTFESFATCYDNEREKAELGVRRVREMVDRKDSFTEMKQERARESESRRTEAKLKAEAAASRNRELDEIRQVFAGLFGVGGGFLLTPLLIFYGIPAAVAVSTQANQILATSIAGVSAHWRDRQVDTKLGTFMLMGGLAGSTMGVGIFSVLKAFGVVDATISFLYIIFLGVIGGLMAYPVSGAGGVQVVEFVRVHNMVRLQARNQDVYARAGTPEARAVESSYSASLLGSTAVASQPHPDSKSVLIEVNGLFLSDMLGVGMMLQRAFRQGYALDSRNTVITGVRSTPELSVIETQNHYYSGTIAIPQPGSAPGAPVPIVPRHLPDTRSMLVGHHYSLAPLPAVPMATRRADARVGLFSTSVLDFSDDLSRSPRQRYIERWRLEKKDPAAEVSEPVKPITFWIDRNVPLIYRETVRSAILEWNKAFERIGFKNAIVVKQQPDDADWDTLDAGVASLRWMTNREPAFGAIGPSHFDPRSGEILDADAQRSAVGNDAHGER